MVSLNVLQTQLLLFFLSLFRVMWSIGWLVPFTQPAEKDPSLLWVKVWWRETVCLWPEFFDRPNSGQCCLWQNLKEISLLLFLNFYRYVLFPVSSSSFLRWGNGPTCPTSHSTFVSAWISWNGTSRFQQWSSVNLSPSSCTCFKTHKAEIRRDNHAAGNTGGTQTWQRQHNKMTMHETLMCTILIISLHLISVKQTFTSISWSLN